MLRLARAQCKKQYFRAPQVAKSQHSVDCAHRACYSARMQAFREWLRATLDERSWTNSDLERASGVSNSIIWRWLADPPRRPTPANLRKIARPLGVSYEEF